MALNRYNNVQHVWLLSRKKDWAFLCDLYPLASR